MIDLRALKEALQFTRDLYDDGVDEQDLELCRHAAELSLAAIIEFLESDPDTKARRLCVPLGRRLINFDDNSEGDDFDSG